LLSSDEDQYEPKKTTTSTKRHHGSGRVTH
jgi:hypothetical protein